MSDPGVEGVLFDKDGTLFDFSATWEAWAAGLLVRLSDCDAARARSLGGLIGYDLDTARFEPDSFVIAGTPDDLVGALRPAFPNKSDTDLLNVLNEEAAQAPMAEAVPLSPLLGRLRKADLKLGVATNDAHAPALAHLDAVGIRAFFSFIAGSDSGFGAKPAAGQLLAFCDHADLAPERCVMVGDSTHDLVAGRAAGMKTVAVLTGLSQADDLAPFADAVFPDIGYLPEWLGLA